ncbi:MAG: hypothetical protein ACI4UN_03030 [Muribaculaceae bacterium]
MRTMRYIATYAVVFVLMIPALAVLNDSDNVMINLGGIAYVIAAIILSKWLMPMWMKDIILGKYRS